MEAIDASASKRIAHGRVSANRGVEATAPAFRNQHRHPASCLNQTGNKLRLVREFDMIFV
jgi:hypothetical protein